MSVDLIRSSFVACLLALAGCGDSAPPAPLVSGANPYEGQDLTGAPNILLIVADDMGYTDIGTFGSEIETPQIDALAAAGMIFSNFHVAAACAPTRAMLLTGVDNHLAGQGSMMYLAPNQRGQPGYEDRLNDRVVTVARLLQDAGYHSYMAGKWHLGAKAMQGPPDRGFERSWWLAEGVAPHYSRDRLIPPHHYFDGLEPTEESVDFYSSDAYTSRLIEFIDRNRDSGRPFFGYLAFTAPHSPLQAPKELVDKYEPIYARGWDVIRAERYRRLQNSGLAPAEQELPPRWPEVPAWDSLGETKRAIEARKMALYAGLIDNMDQNIGRLLTRLRDIGEHENTVVFFLSDNGAEHVDPEVLDALIMKALLLGSDNSYDNMGKPGSFVFAGPPWANVSATHLRGHKGLATEGGIRVPLLVSWPGRVSAGLRSEQLSMAIDIAPTMLAIAGIEHPGTEYRGRDVVPPSGVSLLPYLTGQTETVQRPGSVGYELAGHQAQFYDRWKALKLRPPFGNDQWQLYDILADPGETTDLATRYPERLAALVRDHEHYLQNNGVILAPEGYDALSAKLGIRDILALIFSEE